MKLLIVVATLVALTSARHVQNKRQLVSGGTRVTSRLTGSVTGGASGGLTGGLLGGATGGLLGGGAGGLLGGVTNGGLLSGATGLLGGATSGNLLGSVTGGGGAGGLLSADGAGGLLGGLTSGDLLGGVNNLLGGLSDTVEGTVGDLGAAVQNLVEQVLQLVQDLLNGLANALGTEQENEVVLSTASQLLERLDDAELPAAVREIVSGLPASFNPTLLVSELAAGLQSTARITQFLRDVQAFVPSVNIGQVLGSLALTMDVSTAVNTALNLAAVTGVNAAAFVQSILEGIINQVVLFAAQLGTVFGDQTAVLGAFNTLFQQAVSRAAVSASASMTFSTA